MALLKSFVLLIMILLLTACSKSNDVVDSNIAGMPTEVYAEQKLPNTVLALSANSSRVNLPITETLERDYMFAVLDMSTEFPGEYTVSRRFTEQIINTLLSYGHLTLTEYITDIFIYLHMESDGHEYMVWWFDNTLMLTGDFVNIRESFSEVMK